MVTIAWNPLGFPLIVALPMGRTFNAEYSRDNIFAALTQLQTEDDGRKLGVHADNARAHITQKCRTCCEENGLRLAPHPPYSHDLTLSDFFCSVMSRNVSKEWYFHHTRNYLRQRVKW
jgi:transposase